MSSPARKKSKVGKAPVRQLQQPKPLSRSAFVRKVFERYCSEPVFHYRWFKVEDLASNMNNYFYIDKAFFITAQDLNYSVLRQNHMQMAFDLPQHALNQIGLYRAHFFSETGARNYIYQSTPIGLPPVNLVRDFSTVVERRPLRIAKNQKKQLSDGCNTLDQLKIMKGLNINATGKYSDDDVRLDEDGSYHPCEDSETSSSLEGTVATYKLSFDCTVNAVNNYDTDGDVSFSTVDEDDEDPIYPPNDWWYGEDAIMLFCPAQPNNEPYKEVLERIRVI